MSKQETEIVPDAEPMPFRFRFTDVDGANVRLEVGDDFERNPAWGPGDDALTHQLGMRMCMIGMRFLGLAPEETRTLGALLLQYSARGGDDE